MKHIIFDMGKVLMSFNPRAFLKQHYPSELHPIILEQLFDNELWLQLDQGLIEQEDALELLKQRDGKHSAIYEHCFKSIPEYLCPMEESFKVLASLKDNSACDLYLLSNLHRSMYEYYQPLFDQYFTGAVLSFECQLLKPDPQIFIHLLEKYHLEAKDCIFIDDVKENCEAAKALGIEAIHFNNTNDFTKIILQEETRNV